jgi:hypothetical protein
MFSILAIFPQSTFKRFAYIAWLGVGAFISRSAGAPVRTFLCFVALAVAARGFDLYLNSGAGRPLRKLLRRAHLLPPRRRAIYDPDSGICWGSYYEEIRSDEKDGGQAK